MNCFKLFKEKKERQMTNISLIIIPFFFYILKNIFCCGFVGFLGLFFVDVVFFLGA